MREVEWETLKWVDWYNNRRLLGPIGYIQPAEAEEAFHANLNTLDMVASSLNKSPSGKAGAVQGADKGYDCAEIVKDLRQACVTPHVAQKVRYSAIDGRTTRHRGFAASQKRRKKIEEPFGWAKTVGPMTQTMLRGVKRVGAQFTLTMAACNLARLPRLLQT